jgi:quercetin dioxygenase-like cupin family protein
MGWHTHPNGQSLYVTEGGGRCQRRGGPVAVIRPGDRVFVQPGKEHRHGAAADRFMTHVAMLEVDAEGTSAT